MKAKRTQKDKVKKEIELETVRLRLRGSRLFKMLSLATLSPNSKPSKTREDMVKVYENKAEEIVDNDEKVTIPKLKENVLKGEISAEEYNMKLNILKNRVATLFDAIDNLKEQIKKQNKKIKDEHIKSSMGFTEIKDNIDQIEREKKVILQQR